MIYVNRKDPFKFLSYRTLLAFEMDPIISLSPLYPLNKRCGWQVKLPGGGRGRSMVDQFFYLGKENVEQRLNKNVFFTHS